MRSRSCALVHASSPTTTSFNATCDSGGVGGAVSAAALNRKRGCASSKASLRQRQRCCDLSSNKCAHVHK
eukprot:364166-Chlamydomonas_euryale.AAC.2